MSVAQRVTLGLVLALFMIMPVYSSVSGDSYSLMLFGRIAIHALAAIALNLAVGYAGLISLGHALYLGVGAYVVALSIHHGWDAGWLHLLLCVVVAGGLAAVVGWISLRTRGIAFIMITLAFAQMGYFAMVSLRQYGGDDGMSLSAASGFGRFTGDRIALYLSILSCVIAALFGVARLIASRFGLVLRAAREQPLRVDAVGIPSRPYRLVAYVLSAQLCAVAGFFLANLTGYVSPAYMTWYVSGELLAMVVLGGMGTLFGPVLGAVALLLLEEGLKGLTEHWPLILGALIVALVVVLPGGLWALLGRLGRRVEQEP